MAFQESVLLYVQASAGSPGPRRLGKKKNVAGSDECGLLIVISWGRKLSLGRSLSLERRRAYSTPPRKAFSMPRSIGTKTPNRMSRSCRNSNGFTVMLLEYSSARSAAFFVNFFACHNIHASSAVMTGQFRLAS